MKAPLVVGLTASAERIVQLRENRVLSLNAIAHSETYVDKAAIAAEIAFARKMCMRHGWPIIDVTRRSIEETAAAIIALRDERAQRAKRRVWRRDHAAHRPRLAERHPRRHPRQRRAGLRCRAGAGSTSARSRRGWSGRAHRPATSPWRWPRPRPCAIGDTDPAAHVIGADQTLDAGGERWHKPGSRDEARAQLLALSGRSHRLHAGGRRRRMAARCGWRHVETAVLTMRALSPGAVDAYLDRRRRRRRCRASAPIRSRGRASGCSSASTATISPSSACRFSRCSRGCAAEGVAGLMPMTGSPSTPDRSPASSAGRSSIRARR